MKEGPNGKIGFVCFKDPADALKASQELNGKYFSELCESCNNE